LEVYIKPFPPFGAIPRQPDYGFFRRSLWTRLLVTLFHIGSRFQRHWNVIEYCGL
jgi:hypothetical protein